MLNLPPKPFPVIQKFLNENKLVIYKYLLKQIRKGIRENLDKVELFQINPIHTNNKHVAIVKSADYETVLCDTIKYAVLEEDYETAAKARDTLQLLKESSINKLLNEINPQEQ
jgi:protein-arginine kinase activator protein McsA